MPHESELLPGTNDEVFSLSAPLSPELSAKLKAKKLSKRKIGKVKFTSFFFLFVLFFCWCV